MFDAVHVESPLLPHSFARPELVVLTCMFAPTGFSFPLRSHMCLDFTPLVLGLSCPGFLFVLSVTDSSRFGFLLSVRRMTCCGFSLSVLNFGHFDSSVLLRKSVRVGSTLSLFGMCWFGFLLFVFNHCTVGSSVLLHGLAWLGFVIFTVDMIFMGFMMFLRSPA